MVYRQTRTTYVCLSGMPIVFIFCIFSCACISTSVRWVFEVSLECFLLEMLVLEFVLSKDVVLCKLGMCTRLHEGY